MLSLNSFDKVIVMSYDLRYPEFANQLVDILHGQGVDKSKITVFLNGKTRLHPDWDYKYVQPDNLLTNELNYTRAYQACLHSCLGAGLDSVLVLEDDIDFCETSKPILARVAIPEDWQILYLAAQHYWRPGAEKVGPYLLRLSGQLGFQGVGWRRQAMDAFCQLPCDGAVDSLGAALHGEYKTYCIEPGIVIQRQHVISTISGLDEPFQAGFVFNWVPG